MASKNAPCSCGSGKRFKNCCSARTSNAVPPFATLTIANEKTLLGIFLFALALRLAVFFQMRNSILAKIPILDGAYYFAWAHKIAAGDWSGGTGVYQMSPGYPYVLAVLFRLFGESTIGVTVVQCVIGALSCVITYLIARRFFSERSSAFAGLIVAAYGASVFYSAIINKASWIELLNSASLLTLLLGLGTASPWTMLVPGFLLGVSAQFRPSVLLFLPLAAACVWLNNNTNTPKFKVAKLGALLLGAGIALVPVAVRNRMVGGEWVLTTAHGGMNFYTGCNAQSAAPYRPLPFARSDPKYEQSDFLAEAERRTNKTLTPAEASGFWYAESGKIIRGDVVGWLGILANKFRLLWSDYEQPINQNLYFYGGHFPLLRVLSLISYWLIAPLGLLGLLLSLRNRGLLPLHLYMLAQTVGLVAFFVVSEYRHPMTFALAVYAACSFEWLRTQFYAHAWPKLGLASVFLILVGLSTQGTSKDAVGRRQDLAVAHGNLGISYIVQGNWEAAAISLKRSLEFLPDYGEAHYALGECLLNQNKPEDAKSHLMEGMRLRPGLAAQHYRLLLAQAYSQLGDRDKAIDELKVITASFPNDTPSKLNLVLIYRQSGEKEQAAALLDGMLATDPSNAQVISLATELAISDNDERKVFALLPRLAAAAPNDPNARNLIGMGLARSGHYQEAKAEFERALILMPGHKAAMANLHRLSQ